MEANAIEVKDVMKKRRHKTIGPLTFSLPKGYIIGLIGENGSGKSTLIHMLMQTVIPDEGEIKWFGESYPGGIPTQIRQLIGYVPENSSSEEGHLTAEAAGEFRAYWYENWDQAYFESLLERFHVPPKTKLKKMSKGERRKFEISAALAPHPKLLLLDEPSSGLDPFAWKMMIQELKTCMEHDEMTILISTHIVDEVRRLADYVMLLHHGALMGMVEKDSLMDNWREVWINADAEWVPDLPGVVQWQQEAAGVLRIITTECQQIERMMVEAGMTFLKTRSLELDEILSLWLEGHVPAEVQTGRGALSWKH